MIQSKSIFAQTGAFRRDGLNSSVKVGSSVLP